MLAPVKHWSLPLLFTVACGPAPQQSEPAMVVSAPTVASAARDDSETPPEDPGAALERRVQRAIAERSDSGWIAKERADTGDARAAVIVYEPAPSAAPAHLSILVEVVHARSDVTVSKEASMVEGHPEGLATLVDMRGDGGAQLVFLLTDCGANCAPAEPWGVELGADGPRVVDSLPEQPFHRVPLDGRRAPVFASTLARLVIAPCARASCGASYDLAVEVPGYESWDGQRFAANVAELGPLYERRLEEALAQAPAVQPGKCPLEALRVAAMRFSYARTLGRDESGALTSADRAMKGAAPTSACSAEYDLLDTPATWQALREQLKSLQLPVLR